MYTIHLISYVCITIFLYNILKQKINFPANGNPVISVIIPVRFVDVRLGGRFPLILSITNVRFIYNQNNFITFLTTIIDSVYDADYFLLSI